MDIELRLRRNPDDSFVLSMVSESTGHTMEMLLPNRAELRKIGRALYGSAPMTADELRNDHGR